MARGEAQYLVESLSLNLARALSVGHPQGVIHNGGRCVFFSSCFSSLATGNHKFHNESVPKDVFSPFGWGSLPVDAMKSLSSAT